MTYIYIIISYENKWLILYIENEDKSYTVKSRRGRTFTPLKNESEKRSLL
jgi:hypothetical protein